MAEKGGEHSGIESKEDFDLFFRRYYRLVHYFFMRKGCSYEEAWDLGQETFVKAYKARREFQGKSKPKTWLLQIARNIWLNDLRAGSAEKRKAREVVSIDEDGAFHEPRSRAEDPLARLLRHERHETLRHKLEECPPQMQRCLLLRIDQGLKYREIARVMGISIQTVKSHLYQARERLTREWAASDEPQKAETKEAK